MKFLRMKKINLLLIAILMVSCVKSPDRNNVGNNYVEIPAGDLGEGYYNEIDYFSECMENNSEPIECMPESSLETIRICYDHSSLIEY